MIYLHRIDPFVLPALSEVATEFPKVSAIIFHRMRGVVLLELEIMDEGVDSFVHDAQLTNTTDN